MISKVKDPDEDLDYTWDFTNLLASGETIVSYTFPDAPDDEVFEIHDDASSGTAVTAFVAEGGTVDADYDVACRIVTNANPPRTIERSIKFRMRSK